MKPFVLGLLVGVLAARVPGIATALYWTGVVALVIAAICLATFLALVAYLHGGEPKPDNDRLR